MELLHKAGAGVSNVNARCRTPLMEAALWGRDYSVRRKVATWLKYEFDALCAGRSLHEL